MGPDKAVRVPFVSLAEYGLALADDLVGTAIVQHLGGEEPNARVMVLGVVPRKEDLTEAAGVLEGAKALGEVGSVFQGLELAFRERVVIGDVGPAVALDDAQVGQE